MNNTHFSRSHIAFAKLIESLFQSANALDAYQGMDLASLDGSVFELKFAPLPFSVFALINQQKIFIQANLQGEADAKIAGGILSAWMKLNPIVEVPTTLPELNLSDFEISGNLELAEQFLQSVQRLEIEWEEQLSHYTGDLLAHQIGNGIRNWTNYKKDTGRSFLQMFEEYLQYEIDLAPNHSEVQKWQQGVEDIAQKFAELEERFAKRVI